MNILTINTTSQNDLQPYDEVIVNGVSFLPNEKIPNTVRVYLFDSNGFRIRVHGRSLDDILLETKRLVIAYRNVSVGRLYSCTPTPMVRPANCVVGLSKWM